MSEDPERPDPDHREVERDERTGGSAAAARFQQQARWVDLQLQQAIARGEFDDLAGLGEPIADLGADHDPDWWTKRLVERERITGVLPPALALRKEDAELDARLDRISAEPEARRVLEDFNEQVRKALYQPLGGPPLITRQRDVETELTRWRERRAERWAAQRRAAASQPVQPKKRRWWRRRSRRGGST